ncbi:type 1 glutamine amidotransferase [Mycolicibacterium phlei]
MTSKVLFLYNEHLATEALLGEAFVDEGFDVDTLTVVPAEHRDSPAASQVTFPDPTGYDVIVPLGATWAVYDETLRWVADEMAMVRKAADAGVALLGVCFGGQLLAQAFGGTVKHAPSAEIGWYDLEISDSELIPAGPWFEWHHDQWTLPPGAVEVARTAHSSQAFVLGRALALQFHPEVDRALLEQWLPTAGQDELAAAGLTADELRALTDKFSDPQRVRRLVHNFVTRIVRQPCPSS